MHQFLFLGLPKVKHTLLELVKRQQMGKPLEEMESVPLIERKQGHWLGKLICFCFGNSFPL